MKSLIDKIYENIGWNNIVVSKKNKNIVLYSDFGPENKDDKYEQMAFDMLKKIGADPIINALKTYYKDKTDRLSALFDDIIIVDLDMDLTSRQEKLLYTNNVIKLIEVSFISGSADKALSYYLEDLDNNGDLDEFKSNIN